MHYILPIYQYDTCVAYESYDELNLGGEYAFWTLSSH